MQDYQLKLDAVYKNPRFSYELDIVPILDNYINKDVFANDLNNKINYDDTTMSDSIIVEALAYMLAIYPGRLSNRSKYRIPNQLLLLVFKKYPYLVFSIMYRHTVDEQEEICKELIKEYGNRSDKVTTNLNLLLDYSKNYRKNYKNNNSIVNFNSLIGIRFYNCFVPYGKLPSNRLVIHLGYNYSNKNVLYPNSGSIRTDFLNRSDLRYIHTYQPVNVINSDVCYELLPDKIKNINTRYICICYDNSKDPRECIYGVSAKDVSENMINVLINGGIIRGPDTITLITYFSQVLYKIHNCTVKDTLNETLEDIESKLSTELKKRYDKNVDNCITKWSTFKPDDEYFHIYLSKLHDYTINGELDYRNYVSTIKGYFIPVEY